MTGKLAVMWGQIAPLLKILRQNLLLTGGFTLISFGLGMRFGAWLGVLIGGICFIAYEWHLSRPD